MRIIKRNENSTPWTDTGRESALRRSKKILPILKKIHKKLTLGCETAERQPELSARRELVPQTL